MMFGKAQRTSLLFLLITILFLKGGLAQSSGKYLKQLPQDSFTLLFALPVKMKSDRSKFVFEPDFTYHAYEEEPGTDEVTMNFTLVAKGEPVKKIERIEFHTGNSTFATTDLEFLYLERKGKKWLSRFSSTISLNAYRSTLQPGQETAFLIFTNGNTITVPENRKWRKSAEVIRGYLNNN